MAKLKLAVLISGRGSNLQALIDACKAPDYPAEIVLVVSNKPDAKGLERAEQAGIPTTILEHKNSPDRTSFDNAMTEALENAGAETVCLAGFMRLLSEEFVNHWQNRLINIHPSLLPAFKGLDVHERVIEAGVRFSGCTVHFVTAEMDAGPIIIQAAVPVHPNDTPDVLAARILEQEHKIYPAAVQMIAEGRVTVENGITIIANTQSPKSVLINPMI